MKESKYKWLKGHEQDIPEGWYKAFGEQMIDELNDLLVKYNFVDDYEIAQVKEKFGELRWQDYGVPEEMYYEYMDWIRTYEKMSYRTCYICGEPATYRSKGYILPFCDEHGL